jgi:density-regulated protein DRP1
VSLASTLLVLNCDKRLHFASVLIQVNESEDTADKKAHQKRGGKGMPKTKKERVPSRVVISKQQRKGNKYVTIIQGLGANDIDLETAKKFFANKFSCGCSKGEVDELIIQGDVVDSLFDVIPAKFPQVFFYQINFTKA